MYRVSEDVGTVGGNTYNYARLAAVTGDVFQDEIVVALNINCLQATIVNQTVLDLIIVTYNLDTIGRAVLNGETVEVNVIAGNTDNGITGVARGRL